MPEERVYGALVGVEPGTGCELLPPGAEGAYVRCYTMAPSEDVAMDRIRERLSVDRLTVSEIDWCVDVSAVEWERPSEEELRLWARARASGEVVYDDFHTWGADG